MDTQQAASTIIQAVGGKENILSLAHCATRLRFVLKNESLVQEKELEDCELVKGTFSSNNQYQIIIGAGTVNLVCQDIQNILHLDEQTVVPTEAVQKGNFISEAVKFLSDIFVPIIPAIVAGGLMMGLYNLLTAPFFGGQSIISLYPQFQGLASMINTFSNAPFVFLPVLIGFSATKKFGGNPYLGAAMSMIMVHPDLLSAYSLGTGVSIPSWNIFGLVIDSVGYQGTVLPVLAVSFILASLEKKLHKITPSWLDNLTTPLLSILITALVTFVVVGPVLRSTGDVLAMSITWIYNTLGFFGGALFGGFYAPIVLTGMHHSFIAIETQLISASATTGGSFIFVTASMSNVAQGAAVLAVLFTTTNQKMKSLCGASGISALLGITEPAMFGVNLKLRYPFFAACIGSACGSAWIAFRHVLAVALGAAGLPGFISVHPTQWLDFAIGLVIAMIVSFALTIVFARRQTTKVKQTASSSLQEVPTNSAPSTNITLLNPIKGTIKPMEESIDPVFKAKSVGDGFVIVPHEGNVYAPCDGKIQFIFPTKHAIGFETTTGLSILIHCGMDTVKLEGKGYDVFVKENQEVHQGDLLLRFDLKTIEDAGYSLETPVVLTNLKPDQHITLVSGMQEAQVLVAQITQESL